MAMLTPTNTRVLSSLCLLASICCLVHQSTAEELVVRTSTGAVYRIPVEHVESVQLKESGTLLWPDRINGNDISTELASLAHRASRGDLEAIDRIGVLKEQVYANVNLRKDRAKVLENLRLMQTALNPIGEAAGTSEAAYKALMHANRNPKMRSFIVDAVGIAAARGNKQALEALLNHERHGWLLSSTVFALRAPAEAGFEEAIDFLIAIANDENARPLWHGATSGLVNAATNGNERAKAAIDAYSTYKKTTQNKGPSIINDPAPRGACGP